MKNQKLLDALAELEAQKRAHDERGRVIDEAIVNLRRAVTLLGVESDGMVIIDNSLPTQLKRSYIVEAVEAIVKIGHPLHISEILTYIASVRGERPSRASVEASIIRHIDKAKDKQLVKTGPSTFDVSIHVPTLAQAS